MSAINQKWKHATHGTGREATGSLVCVDGLIQIAFWWILLVFNISLRCNWDYQRTSTGEDWNWLSPDLLLTWGSPFPDLQMSSWPEFDFLLTCGELQLTSWWPEVEHLLTYSWIPSDLNFRRLPIELHLTSLWPEVDPLTWRQQEKTENDLLLTSSWPMVHLFLTWIWLPHGLWWTTLWTPVDLQLTIS